MIGPDEIRGAAVFLPIDGCAHVTMSSLAPSLCKVRSVHMVCVYDELIIPDVSY